MVETAEYARIGGDDARARNDEFGNRTERTGDMIRRREYGQLFTVVPCAGIRSLNSTQSELYHCRIRVEGC